MKPKHRFPVINILIKLVLVTAPMLWLQGCNLPTAPRDDPLASSATMFVPAAASPTPLIPTHVSAHLRPRVTPVVTCENYLTFLDDITVPDETIVEPGSHLDKQWEVQNSGTCNWDLNYTLRLVSGTSMGVADTLPLYPARGGTILIIQISFHAPIEPGNYRSSWQAHNPEGQPFGDQIFVDIIVPDQ